MNVVVDVVRDLAGLTALRERWATLSDAQAHTLGAMSRWEYIHSYVESFAPKDWLVVVMSLAERPEELLAVFPLLDVKAKAGNNEPPLRLLLPLGARFAPYVEYPVQARYRALVWKALRKFAQQHLRADGILLGPFHEDSKHYLHLLEHLPAEQRICLSRPTNYLIETRGEDFESYFSKRPRSTLLKDVRYRLRQLARAGQFEVSQVTDPDECRTVIEQLASWMHDKFADDLFYRALPNWQEVYVKMALDYMASGLIDVAALKLDGKVIASRINFRERSRTMFMHIAHDPACKKFSPNKVLMMHFVERAFKEKGVVCLGPGHYRYKSEWANHCAEIKLMAHFLTDRGKAQWGPLVTWEKIGVLLNA